MGFHPANFGFPSLSVLELGRGTRQTDRRTNPRRTVLLLTLTLTLTFDLSTPNHVTCRISEDHSLYQVWTLWEHSFLSYAADNNVNPYPNANVGLWPFNPKPHHLQDGYPKVIRYTKFEHFGIIRFWVMLRTNKQTDKQTNKQTDSKILPMPTDIVGVAPVGNIERRSTKRGSIRARRRQSFALSVQARAEQSWETVNELHWSAN